VDVDKTVVVAKDQVAANISSETVVLDLKSGIYYGLNSMGTFVWNLIQTPIRIEQIRDAILAEYEVEPFQCEQDLLQLLDDLAKAKLVEFVNELVA
jgi:Coenzyme PQQ synthesis protein D (PqqD)